MSILCCCHEYRAIRVNYHSVLSLTKKKYPESLNLKMRSVTFNSQMKETKKKAMHIDKTHVVSFIFNDTDVIQQVGALLVTTSLFTLISHGVKIPFAWVEH